MASLAELGEISKAQITPGVFEPLTRMVGGKRVVNTVARDAVAARVRGTPVFHGGSKQRIQSIKRGKGVDTQSGVGQGQVLGQGKGEVFTTTDKPLAQLYGSAGRTPEAFKRQGAAAMNAGVTPRAKGSVGEYNMKGQWAKGARQIGGGKTELTYSPEQLKRGHVRTHGIKPHRTEAHRTEISNRSRFEDSLSRSVGGGGGGGAFGAML